MKGMSNAQRHAEYRIARLITAIDKRERTGEREQEENNAHITKVNADGSRVWSY